MTRFKLSKTHATGIWQVVRSNGMPIVYFSRRGDAIAWMYLRGVVSF